jgi:hypothetical protein
VVHLIDFGMAKAPPDRTKKRTSLNGVLPSGTARYMSVDAHVWAERYEKDDLQSLGNVLAYFQQSLPWQSVEIDRREGATERHQKYRQIRELKERESEAFYKGLRDELKQYMAYVCGLTHMDEASYSIMRGFFQRAMSSRGEVDDGRFCWIGDEEPPPPAKRWHR